jgi:hypothetical protein
MAIQQTLHTKGVDSAFNQEGEKAGKDAEKRNALVQERASVHPIRDLAAEVFFLPSRLPD